MANKKQTKTTRKKRTRHPGAKSYKDAQIDYLTAGIGAIDRDFKAGTLSKSTVRRALKSLQEMGRPTTTFEEWAVEHLGGTGRRGRVGPTSGETRTYKVQQIKDGSMFLRLPVDPLNVSKAGIVKVRFDNDRIIVSK